MTSNKKKQGAPDTLRRADDGLGALAAIGIATVLIMEMLECAPRPQETTGTRIRELERKLLATVRENTLGRSVGWGGQQLQAPRRTLTSRRAA